MIIQSISPKKSGEWVLLLDVTAQFGAWFAPYANIEHYFGYALENYSYKPMYIFGVSSGKSSACLYIGSERPKVVTLTGGSATSSSTSYDGMSPLPTKAPDFSGSLYYFNIPSGAYAGTHAGTWAWGYNSSTKELRLYKWEE